MLAPVASPAPMLLAPAWSYSGDDWRGPNAVAFVVYATPHELGSDGVTVAAAGVPQDLTDNTVTGMLRYRLPAGPAARAGATGPPGPVADLPIPAGLVVEAGSGLIALTLVAAQTAVCRPDIAAWGQPDAALLVVQPRIVSPTGVVVTVGLQPLFVF